MALIEIKELHLHIDLKSVDKKADRIINELLTLKTDIMGKFEDLLAKQDAIDAAVEEVKKDLDFIKGQLGQNPDGLNAEQVAAIEARVDSTLARLSAIDSETDSSQPPA